MGIKDCGKFLVQLVERRGSHLRIPDSSDECWKWSSIISRDRHRSTVCLNESKQLRVLERHMGWGEFHQQLAYPVLDQVNGWIWGNTKLQSLSQLGQLELAEYGPNQRSVDKSLARGRRRPSSGQEMGSVIHGSGNQEKTQPRNPAETDSFISHEGGRSPKRAKK